VFANFTGKVQSDIKCALSFASLTQVGIIVAEIGLASVIVALARSGVPADEAGAVDSGWIVIALGLRYWALLHILGHGCWRTLQLVRAPTILYDYHLIENAIGSSLPETPSGSWMSRTTASANLAWYRFALERGFLDSLLIRYVVDPMLSIFRFCDRIEHRATEALSRPDPNGKDRPASSMMEDLV
jgi:hypothetical protein